MNIWIQVRDVTGVWRNLHNEELHNNLLSSGLSQSKYRKKDPGSVPGETKDFSSSLCVQTSSEAHSASCPVGTRGPFPEVKRRGQERGGAIFPLPLGSCITFSWTDLLLLGIVLHETGEIGNVGRWHAYKSLAGNIEGKIPLWRWRSKWDDKNKNLF
jgi:hypothetical protein